MKAELPATFRRNEMYVVAAIIAVVFVAAMAVVAWMLRSSISTAPYEALSEADLKRVFATAYLRHRETDGSPYLKVELHNGTLWWIKKVTFQFDGVPYRLTEADAFRPLRLGGVRCDLKKDPPPGKTREYNLKVIEAFGYPPAEVQWDMKRKAMLKDTVPDRAGN